ncbi:MAG: hypothetical protein KDK33_17430, partial [Leptospiraceae bacterium]|nr:hypothetical protein [Leptospiraceae bacterium]
TVSSDAGIIRTFIVLRAVTPGGVDLVARFPDQGYFDSKGKINSDGEAVVSDILSVIRRYQRYFLRVECHSGIDGREEENLERTEEMAYTIFQEFDGSYWPLDRMTYMGAGETEALYETSGKFQAYRNNRMEFRLEYDNYVEKMEKK